MEIQSVEIKRMTFSGPVVDLIKIGNPCFIGRCGGGISVFGENGKIKKISGNYIYCESESGSLIKYNVKKRSVAGKWSKAGYFVSFNMNRDYCSPEKPSNVFRNKPGVWNSEKCEMEYK